MADLNKRLLRTVDGPAPQQKVAGKNDLEFVEGSDGAQHIKVVGKSGKVQDIGDRLEAIDNQQQEILERLDGTFNTKVTGSNVEYPFVDKDYEGGVIQTRTMGLSWKAFDLFDENIFVPSGAYVDRKSDAAQVNGFSTIGIIVRDERGGSVAKHNFDVHIYWQGIEGGFAPSKAVNEVISFNDEDEAAGLSVSVPTKSEFISFRLFNRSDEDRTYLAKGILRA